MLKIRLQKIGKKNSPSYRVVLVEHTTSPQGKFIELLGAYNPRLKKKSLNKERIEHWLSKGAQPSATVHNLLVDEKIIEREKLMAWKPKRSEAKSSEAVGEGGKKETEAPTPESTSEPVKVEEPKIEEAPKVEEPKVEQPKVDESKAEEVKSEVPLESSPSAEGERLDTETKKE